MNLESQVCSLELAKRLKELNVPQESLFCYQPIKDEKPSVWPRKFNLDEFGHPDKDERVAAFTVAELGELLPAKLKQHLCCVKMDNFWHVGYELNLPTYGDTEANARAKMLIHLLENGLMKAEDLK